MSIKKEFERLNVKMLPIYDTVYKSGSAGHFNTIKYGKLMYLNGRYEPVDDVEEAFLNSDIGENAVYNDVEVRLDYPYACIDEGYELDDSRTYEIYVKHPDTNEVRKIYVNDNGQNDHVTINGDNADFWVKNLPRIVR